MEKELTESEQNISNVELCRRIRENDLQAETSLLMANDRLIVQIANGIKTRRNVNSSDGIDEEDLMQEGRIAMLTAAKAFDEAKNVKFSTFAYEIIRNAMSTLCDYCQSTFERHMEAKGLTRLFLDNGDNAEPSLNGSGNDVNYRDPTGNLAVLHVMLEKMRNRLKLLPARERRLLAYHYGLGMNEAKSISETAAYFHLTEKYARAIEIHTLGRLREMMNDGKII